MELLQQVPHGARPPPTLVFPLPPRAGAYADRVYVTIWDSLWTADLELLVVGWSQ